MALTPEQRQTLMQRLSEAETVEHEWALGRTAGSLSYNGETMTFSQTNLATIRQYIRSLKSQLGMGAARARSRRVVFG